MAPARKRAAVRMNKRRLVMAHACAAPPCKDEPTKRWIGLGFHGIDAW
jgi:hypothetical protein